MSKATKERIAFDVETSRVLKILSSEIYDSPKAFLRENVQNAYDAILMRCESQSLAVQDHRVEITVSGNRITVRDDGLGMTEEVLRNNFWRAGASGKRSELAQRAGVIGTFGIGAMANFGVCAYLRVESRHIDSNITLVSGAKRDDLKIAQDCIDLERVTDDRGPGTLIVAELDPSFVIDAPAACDYLRQYVRFLPVPVSVNGKIISQEVYKDTISGHMAGFKQIAHRSVSRDGYGATLDVSVDDRSRLLVCANDLLLQGIPIEGQAFLIQQGGSILAYRNYFGLAPAPVPTNYGLAGFVNLDILKPTAGREALSRDSIQHVAKLVALVEAEVSVDLANTSAADSNQPFQRYILSKSLIRLAGKIAIAVQPSSEMIALDEVSDYELEKTKQYYVGKDATILSRFANERANLFHVSQVNPRRNLQVRFLSQFTNVQEVPEKLIVDRVSQTELTLEEAMFLIRVRQVLLDDYLMPDIETHLATISHGVAVDVQTEADILHIVIERRLPTVDVVIEYYRTARDVFEGFVKDFVREQIYPHIRSRVPSSQKQGHDALYQRLRTNRELYRLQDGDYGEIETLLTDVLSGKVEFSEVIRTSRRRISRQRQEVSNEQIGTFEDELPDVIESPSHSSEADEAYAAPPISRPNLTTNKKVLTVSSEHPRLNKFQMFLAVSDRMMKRDGVFLQLPHTTRLIWGAHRITYIFTDETGELSLYYDIELKTPLGTATTGGKMYRTTTIVTKNRIFVPVPQSLEPAFQASDVSKEFYVRFDTIP